MCPAHLALLQVDEVVARVAVAHNHALRLLAQQGLGCHLAPRGIDPEMRAPVADLRPRPHHVIVAFVACLVGVAHLLLAQMRVQLLHRLGQRLRDMTVRHRDRTDAELQPHDLLEQTLDFALRQMKLARQGPHQRQGAWSELAAGHTRR